MLEVLRFIFESPYHFLGFLIMMGIVSTWKLISVDVTIIAGKLSDIEQLTSGDDNTNGG